MTHVIYSVEVSCLAGCAVELVNATEVGINPLGFYDFE